MTKEIKFMICHRFKFKNRNLSAKDVYFKVFEMYKSYKICD